ncbi:hypothetical protein J5N97_007546 [Dioscorea zingiberensis]|uniref:Wall-associated receptor kinase galacturonan-binding domain-containing protein n=1 Tax=Dioscorea zingiberensis TaxID=325984 RepID=A0A9D5HTP7_9LILI|nr:hypothetical protein J5N97_007546 [Dioscorea zingiberensis]
MGRRQRCCYWSSPILPSLFLLLLSLSFPPSFTQPTNNTELYYDHCANSPPFPCGNILTDIKYPFLVPGRPEFCGHPDFFLICQRSQDEDKLLINIGDKSYHVMEKIDYQNRVLQVIDAELDATTSSSCPEKLSNITLDFSLFDYLDGNKDINLTLFLNCKKDFDFSQIPLIDLLFPIECSNAYSGQYSYFTLQNMINGLWPLSDLYHNCRSTVLLPVYNNALIQGMFAPDGLVNANFSIALRMGFGLTWNVGKGWCYDECLKSGGICGTNITDFKPACFCPRGTAINGYSCTTHTGPVKERKNKLIIIGSLSGVGVILLISCLWSLCYCNKRQQHTSSTLLLSCWHHRTSEDQTIEAFLQKHGTLPPKRYRYLEVKRMTESFHHKLGEVE